MKRNMFSPIGARALIALIIALSSLSAMADYQSKQVKSILNSFNELIDQQVQTIGTVKSFQPGESGRSGTYELKGQGGDLTLIVRYSSQKNPVEGTKAFVRGIVKSDQAGNPELIETERRRISAQDYERLVSSKTIIEAIDYFAMTGEGPTETVPPRPENDNVVDDGIDGTTKPVKTGLPPWVWIVAIVGGVVVLTAIIIMVTGKKKKPAPVPPSHTGSFPAPPSNPSQFAPPPQPAAPIAPPVAPVNPAQFAQTLPAPAGAGNLGMDPGGTVYNVQVDDNGTVYGPPVDSGTVVGMGALLIDSKGGAQIPLVGSTECEIGRDDPGRPPQGNAPRISLDLSTLSNPKQISRRQLIIRKQGMQFSAENPEPRAVCKVDGRVLAAGVQAPLKDGSIIELPAGLAFTFKAL